MWSLRNLLKITVVVVVDKYGVTVLITEEKSFYYLESLLEIPLNLFVPTTNQVFFLKKKAILLDQIRG